MECTVLKDEMIEVLYGNASPATARVVEEHAAVCESCREELRALRRLRETLGAWNLRESARPLGLGSAARAWLGPLAAALILAAGAAVGFALSEARLARVLDAREARHREEIATLRTELQGSPPALHDDAVVLAEIDARIRQSEARQAALLKERLTDLADQTEAQRRYDLARVSAGLSYLDGRTGQTVARTAELMGYVLQASQKR
ncbi:MAG: anti-sigma factor family protein [Vicinamibacteria bacterium]